jgi:SAM-dependent methyltransferase
MRRLEDPIPQIFHAHHAQHKEDIPFWLELAREQGDPILELGCGTGRVIVSLSQAGCLTFGLDREAGMLAFLRANHSPDILSRVHIFIADLEAFHLGRQFPLILLPCNTLNTLSAKTRKKALALISQHLSPGGLFAASLPNPDQLARLPTYGEMEVEETINHPLSGNPLQISSEWEKTSKNFLLRWHYDHLYPDGRVERLTIETCHDLAPVETYLAEIRAAGMLPSVLFGDYDRSVYKTTSPYLILICQKILI